MLSVLNSGVYNLNPITSCKLYKAIVQPSTLFGCELWWSLNTTEKLMLERFQRFCAKTIQHLSRRARSDICVPMLGLTSIKAYIDNMVLSFFRRLMALPSHCISKEIFMRRWYQFKAETSPVSNFCQNLHEILDKYKLSEYVQQVIFDDHFVPDKLVWKRICKSKIVNIELNSYKDRTTSTEFDLFHAIHPDITDFTGVWYFAKSYRHKLDKCFLIAKHLAEPCNDNHILCEFCGRMYKDTLVHKVMICDRNVHNFQTFWEHVTNECPVELGVYLHNLDDISQLQTMLGAPLDVDLTEEEYNKFFTLSVDLIASCL